MSDGSNIIDFEVRLKAAATKFHEDFEHFDLSLQLVGVIKDAVAQMRALGATSHQIAAQLQIAAEVLRE